MEQLYDRIKQECDSKNITIKQLEKDAGVANGTVGKWRKGAPRVTTLQKISERLGVSMEELITLN